MQPIRLAIVLPLIALAVSAQQPATAPDRIPTLHVTTRIVALDVVITDGHGKPTAGLKPSDLTLTEDGVPQTILSFTEHDASAAPQPDSQLPPNTFTVQQPTLGNGAVTVIVLGNMSPDHDTFIRAQIKTFVATAPIATPIAIFRGDWQGVHLIQGLTTDRSVLMEAANSQRILPPLGFPVRYAHLLGPPQLTLTHYLAQIPGRINLVWFGEVIPPSPDEGLFPDLAGSTPQDLATFLRTAGNSAGLHRLSRVAFYPVIAGGLVAPPICMGRYCPVPDMTTVAYTRALGAMPCLDLRVRALSAGGEAFCDSNGFKDALSKVVAIGSHYYTVSYRPTNPHWDGKYRNIKIQLANAPPEPALEKINQWIESGPAFLYPQLNYRGGYYARDTPAPSTDVSTPPAVVSGASPNAAPTRTLISLSPRGQGSAIKTPMERAMGFGTLTPTQIHFTIAVTPAAESEKLRPGEPLPPQNFLTPAFRDFPYRTCKVHYWIDPQDLHFKPAASGIDEDQVQFVAMVYRDDGLIANSLAYTTTLRVAPDQLEDIQANGLTFDQTIAVTVPANPGPGNFFLRAGVDQLSDGHIGALEVPIEWIKPPTNP